MAHSEHGIRIKDQDGDDHLIPSAEEVQAVLNAAQRKLTGTGFVKSTAGVITYEAVAGDGAPASQSLAATANTDYTITTQAVASQTTNGILQTIWNKIRSFQNFFDARWKLAANTLGSFDDFNKFTTPGIYLSGAVSGGAANAPFGSTSATSWLLIVFGAPSDGRNIIQVASYYNTNVIYSRKYQNGTWTAWNYLYAPGSTRQVKLGDGANQWKSGEDGSSSLVADLFPNNSSGDSILPFVALLNNNFNTNGYTSIENLARAIGMGTPNFADAGNKNFDTSFNGMGAVQGMFNVTGGTFPSGTSSGWWHVITSCHRGGGGNDGNLYTLMLAAQGTTGQRVFYRKRTSQGWVAWREVAPADYPLAGDVTGTIGATVASNMSGFQSAIPASSNPSAWPAGTYAAPVYNNGYPAAYGTVWISKGSKANSCVQLFIEWSGQNLGIGGMWWRNARDDHDGFSAWQRVVAGSELGDYLPLAGGYMSGIIYNIQNPINSKSKLIWGQAGDSDGGGLLIGATGINSGYLEIATVDDGNEPIYVRQYDNGQSWGGGNMNQPLRTLTLLDEIGDTKVPGSLWISSALIANKLQNRTSTMSPGPNNGSLTLQAFNTSGGVGMGTIYLNASQVTFGYSNNGSKTIINQGNYIGPLGDSSNGFVVQTSNGFTKYATGTSSEYLKADGSKITGTKKEYLLANGTKMRRYFGFSNYNNNAFLDDKNPSPRWSPTGSGMTLTINATLWDEGEICDVIFKNSSSSSSFTFYIDSSLNDNSANANVKTINNAPVNQMRIYRLVKGATHFELGAWWDVNH